MTGGHMTSAATRDMCESRLGAVESVRKVGDNLVDDDAEHSEVVGEVQPFLPLE